MGDWRSSLPPSEERELTSEPAACAGCDITDTSTKDAVMSRAAIILPILLGIIVVLWGCSPYQTASNAPPDKTLEVRVEKLEKELKAAKEQNTLASADLKAEQVKRIAAEKERDGLKLHVKARGDELAKAQTDLDGLRKGLKDLLGKADAALAPFDAGGVTVTVK